MAEKELKRPIKKFGSTGLETEEPMGKYELDEQSQLIDVGIFNLRLSLYSEEIKGKNFKTGVGME